MNDAQPTTPQADPPPTIMAHGAMYIRHDLGQIRVRQLETERDELQKLLDAYRQTVFEVKERLSRLDNDQADWLK